MGSDALGPISVHTCVHHSLGRILPALGKCLPSVSLTISGFTCMQSVCVHLHTSRRMCVWALVLLVWPNAGTEVPPNAFLFEQTGSARLESITEFIVSFHVKGSGRSWVGARLPRLFRSNRSTCLTRRDNRISLPGSWATIGVVNGMGVGPRRASGVETLRKMPGHRT